jgi:flagellar biosynthesis component FlhA
MTSSETELKDLILPVSVVAVVGIMIFPLPSAALDVLLMCNISFSLVLLLSSVYLSQPEKFTSLPTILLLSTLFRLGLNISTTRRLLSGGSVPDIVVTFGNFVVYGNFTVGVVIFSIITIVQFLVISKGAERVAEVAARFTLDAMPGKQMSIDADLRAGILNLSEAKERRRELQREAKLYGALDGAVKFVKGDAIAGLLITIINIVGGLIVGVIQQNLSLAEAAARYTLFTIGDGLVSQIPALLVAVSAGITVTRVSDREGELLGRDMLGQLSKEPQALGTTAAVLLLLSFVPGLPLLPFMSMAGILALGARRVRQRGKKCEKGTEQTNFHAQIFSGAALRITVEAAYLLQKEEVFPRMVQKLRRDIFEQWGVIVPDLQFDIDRNKEGVCTGIYLNGIEMLSVSKASESVEGGTSGSYGEQVISALQGFFIEHLSELVNDTQTRMLLDLHQTTAEDLINSVVPEVLSVTALTTLLRQLIIESVSVRSLVIILQAIAEYRLCSKDAMGKVIRFPGVKFRASGQLKGEEQQWLNEGAEMLAVVRIALKRFISRTLADEHLRIKVWMLNREIDHLLGNTSFADVPLDPDIVQALASCVGEARRRQSSSAPVVIVSSKYARQLLAGILREEFDDVKVVAVEELCNEVRLQVLGEVSAGEIIVGEESTSPASSEDADQSKKAGELKRAAA